MNKSVSASVLAVMLATVVGFGSTQAIDADKVPAEQRTKSQLYLAAQEVNALIEREAKATLFVDVRDPAELFALGMPQTADVNIPFKRINVQKWDDKKKTFALDGNPGFVSDVEAALKAKGLDKTGAVVLMCGSGKRSAKAVDALTDAGFTNVYLMVDGFKGWQAGDLPWSRDLDKAKMYGNPAS
jgi:rhodanese-related sulfurtransferase